MASSRQRNPRARAEPASEEKGPWWENYFKFVFTNRAVRDEARKKDGIVINRPIHRGLLEEPDSNERFEILWKVGADYDYIDADIMDWQQLKKIITDRFVPIKAVAPMVEHIILPLQERNWHATDQEFQQMRDASVAAAKRWQERVKQEGKLLDQLTKAVDGKQQQAKQQQKKKASAQKEAKKEAAGGGKAAKGKAAVGAGAGSSKGAAAGSSKAAAGAGAGSSKGAAAGSSKAAAGSSKAAAAKPAKAAPAAAAAAAAAGKAAAGGKAAAAAPGKGAAKAGSSGAAAAAGSKKRPAAAVALSNKKQKVAAAAAAAQQDDSDDDFEDAAPAAAPPGASKQQKKKQAAVKQEQEQNKRSKSDAGAAAAAEVTYKGHTGRLYPAAVACKPKDRRIGTRAYQEGDADGEYPVAAIVDEVSFTVLGKKKHMVLPKWQGYELDVNGWEDAAGMSGLECYKEWQQDKPAYYTAVTKAAAANAFIAWQNKA